LSRLWHFYALLLQHFPLETTVAIPPKKWGMNNSDSSSSNNNSNGNGNNVKSRVRDWEVKAFQNRRYKRYIFGIFW